MLIAITAIGDNFISIKKSVRMINNEGRAQN